VKEMKINEKNEHQKLSNLECVAKTIRYGYLCCFQCNLGLVNIPNQSWYKKAWKSFFFIFHSLSFFSHEILFIPICLIFFFFGKLLKLHQNGWLLEKIV
jgi:hypothetical protein